MTPPSPIPAAPAESPAVSVTLRGAANVDVAASVAECGTGKPVVFLHGLVGLNDHWEEVVRSVRRTSRCVMLELPLLELTGDDCSIHGVTELTVRFLERHVREPSVLVGNSFGGHVALKIALDRSDLVRGLVLAGSSGLLERTMVSDIQLRPSREWLVEKIGELFYDRSKMRPEDVDRAHKELSNRHGARAIVRLSRSARKNHLGDEIHRIKTPTLVVWGKEDIVTPPEAAAEFIAKIKNSRIVWFDRCGHAPMIECPNEFAQAMTEFLADLDRAG